MSVVVSLQDVGPCRKQLTVEVPAPAVEAETQRVVQEYGRRAKIPGFRQGKVPAHVVRKRFAKDIENEVIERLLPRYWRQAQAESSIDPLLPPELAEDPQLTPGEPFTFTALVEVRPQIELRNIKDFELPDPPVEPGTMEVDEKIDELRKQLAEWVPVERSAARGDLVVAEITELTPALHASEGEEPKTETVQIEVGDERVWEELSAVLQGMSAGQTETFERHEEAVQHGDHEHPARDRRFRIQVTAVKERDLPPLDDELAKKVGADFETVDQLREAVTLRLQSVKRDERREKRQRALLDQLRERHPLELPQGVVKREVEGIVQDQAENLARRGVDVEHAGIDWNAMANEMLPLAEQRVHARLLLDAISDSESIQVTEEEFELTLAALARARKTSTPALRKSMDENGQLATLRSQLRRDKTIRHLLGEMPAETLVLEPEAELASEA
ncbi:MAG TPA: trigger factor [Thermoanaerobaculia bacterium]|jgi:trigger factor|nr:trigger factor [Thermoanaerobaculia bacterium]